MTVFDPLRGLQTLYESEVVFVVIGVIAAAALGSPSVTTDLDICYDRSQLNLERLAAALRRLSATLRGAPEEVGFQLDARSLKNGDTFTFQTSAGPLDVIGTPAGTSGYYDLARDASSVDFDDFQVLVVSIDDLIRMKRAAGRPKDRVELEILGALRDELDESV